MDLLLLLLLRSRSSGTMMAMGTWTVGARIVVFVMRGSLVDFVRRLVGLMGRLWRCGGGRDEKSVVVAVAARTGLGLGMLLVLWGVL